MVFFLLCFKHWYLPNCAKLCKNGLSPLIYPWFFFILWIKINYSWSCYFWDCCLNLVLLNCILCSNYASFSIMFTGAGFLLLLRSLDFLFILVYVCLGMCVFFHCLGIYDSLNFSCQHCENLVMTTGCLGISYSFPMYSSHPSHEFFSELPCLVRSMLLLLLCFERPGKIVFYSW